MTMSFIPPELMMNVEFTKETVLVRTQVENKHESRNRKALSWITRKRWREVPSRERSAITSAVSSYACLWMAIVDISGFFYSQTSLDTAICLDDWQMAKSTAFCGLQTQYIWPIKTKGSTMNKITMAKRCRFRCSGLIRMMVRDGQA